MALRRSYCPSCDDFVPAEVKSPSHLLHFLLTIVTAGLWLPIWIVCAIDTTANCRHCGSTAYRTKFRMYFERYALRAAMVFFGLIVLSIIVVIVVRR